MDKTQERSTTPRPVIFRDGLGRRCRLPDARGNDKFEVLCLRPELTAGGTFEQALRERTSHLAGFRHEAFARIRSIDHLRDAAATLVLVSECTPGVRLSEALATTERVGLALDGSAAWSLVRQLVASVASLHEYAPDAAHGAIAPERIIVTPDARLVLAEYVMGGALERLHYPRDRYWRELRIAYPRTSRSPALDLRADVLQIGVVALALMLGRPLRDDEYPGRIEQIVESAWITSLSGDHEPMPAVLRTWLDRALQLDDRRSFASAIEASAELGRVIQECDSLLVPLALEAFLARMAPHADLRKRSGPRLAVQPTAPPPAVPAVVEADHAPVPDPAAVAPAVETAERVRPTMPAASGDRPPAAQPDGEAGDPAPWPSYVTEPAPIETDRWATPDLSTIARAATTAWQRRESWTQRAWSRQAAAAAVLIVIFGAGWIAASRLFDHPRSGVAAAIDSAPRSSPANPAPSWPDAGGQPLNASPPLELATATAIVATTVLAETVPAAAAVETTSPAPTPATGWIVIAAPAELEVYEGAALLGGSQAGRIALPAGAHQIELVSNELGYRSTRRIDVRANETRSITVELPNGTLALNATPWAEVLVDGRSVGETPIGNLPISVGSHEIVFRHPELGEKRVSTVVTLTAPTRLSVDMRAP